MNKPLLSICIPTYNRSTYLRWLLESIVSQKGFTEEVEIIIYDDPSSDNTQEMVSEYIKKYTNIIYHRNIERVWMTTAFVESVLLCNGEYTWLFWSDDIIWPNAIECMLGILKDKSLDLVLNDYGDFRYKDIHTNIDKDISLFHWLSEFYNNFHQHPHPSFDNFIAYFSYISVYCFRTSIFKNQYAISLEQWCKNFILEHYFNFSYLLFCDQKIGQIGIVHNPVLTYNQWWKPSWRMNFKILKDVYSLFWILENSTITSKKTKRIFLKIKLTWLKWYVNAVILHSYPVQLLKKDNSHLYQRVSKIYTYLYNKFN